MEICIAGDDARPPWNNASSILAKRLTECLSAKVKCYLASLDDGREVGESDSRIQRISMGRTAGRQGINASRLAAGVRQTSADIVHIVGTNALVFSPICKLMGGNKRIVRHVFTSYDRKDRIIRPARRLVNSLFIDCYAFTTPWIGEWESDLTGKTRKFLLRPPVDCDLYKPRTKSGGVVPDSSHDHTVLYMGPLLPSRFPAASVLGALKRLVKSGVKTRLIVLTSVGRTSVERVHEVVAQAKSLSIEDSLQVRRVDLTEAERVEAYNAADVVIFPFVGPIPEKLADPPFGLLEAMACGRVVLGTQTLSIPEVVEDRKNGFIARSASTMELRDGLFRALTSMSLNDVEERARQKIIGEFSYPTIRNRALEMFQSLLSSSYRRD